MVRKRDVEGAVPYAKLYVCRGDHRSPDVKQMIEIRATPQSTALTAPLNGSHAKSLSLRRGVTK